MCVVDLKQLVDELVSLNDENLARRVVDSSDVQWCLSELQDMLSDDVVEVVRCGDCKSWKNGDCYRQELTRPDDFCSYGERRKEK